MVFISLLISSIPLLFLIRGLSSNNPKPLRQKILPGLLAYLVLLGVTSCLHLYFRSTYDFPLLPSVGDFTIGFIMLIIFGAIFLLVGIVSLVITRDLFGTMVALFILILLLVQIFLSIFWFASLGEKWEYAEILDRAERVFATAGDEEAKQEISVELLYSARGFCWRDCSTEDYRNLFMVKNHLDQPVQAELKILAANERKQQLAMYESLPIDLQPGEYRVVVTEETNLEDSVWDRWTSYTDEKIAFFQYKYRYEPIK